MRAHIGKVERAISIFSRREDTNLRPSPVGFVARTALLALCYTAISWLSLKLAIPPGYVSPVWPAAGVSVAAVLIWGYWMLPGVWLGSFLTNLALVLVQAQTPIESAVDAAALPAMVAFGAAAQASMAVVLIRRLVGYPGHYDTGWSVAGLLGLAGPVACLISAAWGTANLYRYGVIGANDVLFNAWGWWIGDTLGVLLFLPLTLLLFGRPRAAWGYRRYSVGVPLLVSFGIAVAILLSSNQALERRFSGVFEREVNAVITHLQQDVSEIRLAVSNLAALVSTLPELRYADFLDLAQPALQTHSYIHSLQWLPHVPDGELERFIERTRAEEFPDFTVTHDPARNTNQHFPRLYVAPIHGQDDALGVDVFDTAAGRYLFDQLAALGPDVFVRQAIAVPGRDGTSLYLAVPVFERQLILDFKNTDYLRAMRGIVLAELQIEGLLDGPMMRETLPHLQLVITQGQTGDLPIYASPVNLPTSLNIERQGSFVVAGQLWSYQARPTLEFMTEHRSIIDWTILASALAISGLLGGFLLMVTGRMSRVESAVAARTASLNSEIAVRRNVESALRESEARYRRLAFQDSLTGLANREYFSRKLVDAISACRGRSGAVAVHFFDLDHFKDINDAKGHPVGDELLIRIAEAMRGSLRSEDTLARLGGDEFAILQPTLTDRSEAAELARRIIRQIAQPFLVNEYEVRTSTSVGIAFFKGEEGGERSDEEIAVHLMEEADIALYEVKERQRGEFAFHSLAMSEKLHHSIAIGHELKRVLDEDSPELSLAFQPQVSFATGKICAFEALLRWKSGQLGQVSPAEFVAIAEARGLITELGRFTLRKVCEMLKTTGSVLPDGTPYRVAVNISVTQFTDPAFVTDVISTMDRYGIAPQSIELEVTEAALARSIDQVQDNMQRLRRFGVSIAIDDFGTGYSSLLYLKRMPLTRLKVAQEFVRDMLVDPADAEIVRATIQIAKALELELIAEGVETREHAERLKTLGCEIAQGYYFHRPIAQADLMKQWETGAQSLFAA